MNKINTLKIFLEEFQRNFEKKTLNLKLTEDQNLSIR